MQKRDIMQKMDGPYKRRTGNGTETGERFREENREREGSVLPYNRWGSSLDLLSAIPQDETPVSKRSPETKVLLQTNATRQAKTWGAGGHSRSR